MRTDKPNIDNAIQKAIQKAHLMSWWVWCMVSKVHGDTGSFTESMHTGSYTDSMTKYSLFFCFVVISYTRRPVENPHT